MAGLNYETENSQKIIKQILAYLLGRPREGATLKQIQAMLGVSHGTAHRFVNHLTLTEKIHLAAEAKATQAGHKPGVYRLGYKIVTPLIPGLKYRDIPLNFFGKNTMTQQSLPLTPVLEMTEYLPASQYHPHPGRVGPYCCKMIGAFDDGSGITHMRWWDGKQWSYPLQPDHQDLDGHYCKPEDTYFNNANNVDAEDVDEYLKRFAWAGLAEDPDPL